KHSDREDSERITVWRRNRRPIECFLLGIALLWFVRINGHGFPFEDCNVCYSSFSVSAISSRDADKI
ncbi:MAG TPA: hypothetical protein VKA34_13120, partial [Balneolales bacterium]|nr:hypothetical protein [Balneolales bacterium]